LKKNIAVFLLLFITVNISALEWKITQIDINVKGITQSSSIIRVSQLREGQIFKTLENLEDNLDIARDNLFNERIFNSIELNYEIINTSKNQNLIKVVINVEDSWNIVALPYPKYDSNSGFTFSLRGRDYNFLGLMEPLAVNLNYNFDENSQHNFDLGLNYVINFPIMGQHFSLGLNQAFYYKPADENDPFYMRSSVSLGTGIMLPWEIYRGNKINYGLSFSLGKNYWLPEISEARDDLSLGFGHSLSLGQVSWGDNNYREGITYSLSNSWSLSLDEGKSFNDSWSTSLSGNTTFHRDWYPLGYSGRISFEHNLRDTQSNRGGPLRGTGDDKISSRGGVFANNGLYITVWNNPAIWEIMGGPCLDMGYLWDAPVGQDNFVWSLAVDGLCYPSFAKSFQARITIGLDGNGFVNSPASGMARLKGNMELFFGLGTFF
jgi:hypothetical protein